ncbi:MAG TPA: alpha/beta hydrolase [Gammaproteobacteria bacterium]|nr:alpha/beta hydrolase [Gammaproteobacteria bacterium]
MNTKIKAILLLCLFSLFGTAHAQVSSLTYSVSGGTITLNWYGFASTHYVRENGVTISQVSGTTKSFYRPAGTYNYKVTSCYYDGDPSCIYSNSVNVTVAATPPPPVTPVTPPPPLEFSVGSLQQFLALADGKDKTLANFVGDEIRARLHGVDLTLDENGLTFSENLPDYQIHSGCSKNIALRNLQVNASLNNTSRFEILMDTLSKPIVVNAQLIGTVEGSGTVRVRLGFKVFGECIRYLKASVDGSVRTDFTVNTSMVIWLNPTRVLDAPSDQIRIRINPDVNLDGRVVPINPTVNLSNASLSVLGVNAFSGVAGDLMQRYLLNYMSGKLTGSFATVAGQANANFQTYLASEKAKLKNKLLSIPQEYIIPAPADLTPDMLRRVTDYALNAFPAGQFLQNNSADILYLLLVGDDKGLRAKIGTQASCILSGGLLSLNMSHAATPSPFRTTTMVDYCANIENPAWLGNAEPSVSGYNGTDAWTLTPPTSFNVSVVAPIQNNYQPYMQRVNYRNISGITDGTRVVIDYNAFSAAMSACHSAGYMGQCNNPPNINNYTTYVPIPRGTGTCKLEMRVYKKDVAQTGLKPLLAIHGGSWKYRGTGFYGLEAQVSNFTQQGFVVFAPFYRLIGNSDGNVECNNATGQQITSDVDAALTWVQNYMTSYGVTAGQKVRLFGQSSGASLAGWLLTHRPTEVQKALLMYPPTDAQDYLINYQAFINSQPYNAEYASTFTGGESPEIVAGYLSTVPGVPANLREVSPYSSLVLDNSFPYLVASNPSYYPPAYMVHGMADGLVPALNSVRLCNAYTGNPASGPATTAGTATLRSYACGSSRVDLLQEAGHALEGCLPPLRCQAGSSSAALIAAGQSLSAARAWLAQ